MSGQNAKNPHAEVCRFLAFLDVRRSRLGVYGRIGNVTQASMQVPPPVP